MFLIIDQNGKRIQITGDMQIYGHGADMILIAEQIVRQVRQNKIDYGWIQLKDEFIRTDPTPWEAPPPEPIPEAPEMIEWEA